MKMVLRPAYGDMEVVSELKKGGADCGYIAGIGNSAEKLELIISQKFSGFENLSYVGDTSQF